MESVKPIAKAKGKFWEDAHIEDEAFKVWPSAKGLCGNSPFLKRAARPLKAATEDFEEHLEP